jgi:hypothetical protein
LLGFIYVHLYPFDVSLPPDPKTSPAFQGTHGDTSYYFFETQDLPLFAPLRMLGVPESLIDVVEPFFRVIVDLGYDRSIPPWEPTPARLIPTLDPATVATDLVNAIGEGINNALSPVGTPAVQSIPAAVTLAAPATETAKADVSPSVESADTPARIEQVASTMEVAETAKPNEASTEATAASGPEASASDDASEPTKPKARAATPRPVVRDSLGSNEQRSGVPQPGNGASKAESSSAASSSATSSPTESNSSGDDSSGGDADGC